MSRKCVRRHHPNSKLEYPVANVNVTTLFLCPVKGLAFKPGSSTHKTPISQLCSPHKTRPSGWGLQLDLHGPPAGASNLTFMASVFGLRPSLVDLKLCMASTRERCVRGHF